MWETMMIGEKKGGKKGKKKQEFFSSLSSMCFINNFNRNQIILEGKVLALSSCTKGVTNLNSYCTSILSDIIQHHLLFILCQKQFQGCFPKPVLLLHKNTAVPCLVVLHFHMECFVSLLSHVHWVEVTFYRENA